ncbi:PREDICTED: uncharacterized protein LOC109205321 [Nicotiana attenuata]|uniref:uncharacterized protein LOC109205321 n=1 Tax=Nicotiana attenuata TaxID=49451 RepID=UPI0009056876|nr:PREDICTED: uncharacterized protein LOC109205321 [Nicotiana attenuata]
MVDDGLKMRGETTAQKKKEDGISMNKEIEESKYMSALPFPQKQRREKLDKQFERFLEVFKQVHVNKPFTEVLSQMPTYAKKIEGDIVQEAESGRDIGGQAHRAFLKLEGEIGEIRSIHVSLQLADQTKIIPKEIVEDVLVRVEKLVFLVDFIVVNMEENGEVLLILGRPFLAMGRAILDI